MPPCGAKETAEFYREKRHCHDFMYRRTPFQNPATARTAGSCERTGATKAPVLSPALSFVPRKRAKGLRVIFHKGANSAPNPARTSRQGQGLCPSRNRGTQRLTRPNRGYGCVCPLPAWPGAASPCQQHRNIDNWQGRFSSLYLRPLAAKWVRASARKRRPAAARGKPNALLAPPKGG